MSQYITLLGAEEVGRASRTMTDAADAMTRAADIYAEAVRQQQISNENFLIQLRDILQDDRTERAKI